MENLYKMHKPKKAQSTYEYAILVTCLIAALVAMQVYIKRSIQGRLRATADSVGEQYAPENTTSDITLSFSSDYTTTVRTTEQAGVTTTTTDANSSETQDRSGSETVGPLGSP